MNSVTMFKNKNNLEVSEDKIGGASRLGSNRYIQKSTNNSQNTSFVFGADDRSSSKQLKRPKFS